MNVPALYQENGEYRYQSGWNVTRSSPRASARCSPSILPNFTSILPAWWGVYGWFFGVAIAGAVYLVMSMFMPRPISQAASQAAVESMPPAAAPVRSSNETSTPARQHSPPSATNEINNDDQNSAIRRSVYQAVISPLILQFRRVVAPQRPTAFVSRGRARASAVRQRSISHPRSSNRTCDFPRPALHWLRREHTENITNRKRHQSRHAVSCVHRC